MSRRLALFVNPSAGGGRSLRALAEARAELDALSADYRVQESIGRDACRRDVAAAAARGDTVVAIGGDGMIGLLAGVLKATDATLAIVPAGRGNDFARVLGIPSEPRAAARIAAGGNERAIDVGDVNGESFVGIASLGFDSDANRIANEAKLVRGNLVYLYAALRALAAWRHATFRVVVDGEAHEVTGYSVAVANNKAYGGGMYLAPHAELDDGRLDVLLVGAASKLRALRDLPKVFKGSHLDNPYVRTLRGASVEVSADRPFTVYADGDPIAELPVRIGIAPRALKVVVP